MSLTVKDWQDKIHYQTGIYLMSLSPLIHRKANNAIHEFLTQLSDLLAKTHAESLSEDEAKRTYKRLRHKLDTTIKSLPELSLAQRNILNKIVYQTVYDDVNSSLPFMLIGEEGIGDVQAYTL